MILPGPLSPCTGETPESITATSTPRPVNPAVHQSDAPLKVVAAAIEYGSVLALYVVCALAVPVFVTESPKVATLNAAIVTGAQRRGPSHVVPALIRPVLAEFIISWFLIVVASFVVSSGPATLLRRRTEPT